MLLLLVVCVRESEDMCVFAHMRGGLLTVNLSVAMDGGGQSGYHSADHLFLVFRQVLSLVSLTKQAGLPDLPAQASTYLSLPTHIAGTTVGSEDPTQPLMLTQAVH